MRKNVAALLLLATLLFAHTAATANADEDSPRSDANEQVSSNTGYNSEREQERQEAILLFEQHLYLTEANTLALNIDSRELPVDPAIEAELVASIATINEQLFGGELAVEQVSYSTGSSIGGGQAIPVYEVDSESPNCAGVTGVFIRWYGYTLALDNCKTGVVSNMIKGGVGVSALCSYLVNSVQHPTTVTMCSIAKGVLVVGAARIDGINALGGYQGITIDFDWTYNFRWIWHQ